MIFINLMSVLNIYKHISTRGGEDGYMYVSTQDTRIYIYQWICTRFDLDPDPMDLEQSDVPYKYFSD